MTRCQCDELLGLAAPERIGGDDECTGLLPDKSREGVIEVAFADGAR